MAVSVRMGGFYAGRPGPDRHGKGESDEQQAVRSRRHCIVSSCSLQGHVHVHVHRTGDAATPRLACRDVLLFGLRPRLLFQRCTYRTNVFSLSHHWYFIQYSYVLI
jgi:hypothetical protein